ASPIIAWRRASTRLPHPSGCSMRSRNCGRGRDAEAPPHRKACRLELGGRAVPPSATFPLIDSGASAIVVAAASVYSMQPIISVSKLSKTYASGFRALKSIDLDIRRGEIFALLGPNGAGKTTLISIICGIVTLSEGKVSVAGHDIVKDYRVTRSMIGLVPKELATEAFGN